MGWGVVVLVNKLMLYRYFIDATMKCMSELCGMNVYSMNCNEWIFNELWMKFKLPMNFKFNRMNYTIVKNLEF